LKTLQLYLIRYKHPMRVIEPAEAAHTWHTPNLGKMKNSAVSVNHVENDLAESELSSAFL
jgi:hypothetical protein